MTGAVGPKQVNHRAGGNPVVLQTEVDAVPAGMFSEHVIFNWVAGTIEHDAVNGVVGVPDRQTEVGSRDLIGFHQSQIEFDSGGELLVVDQNGEGFAVAGMSHPHRSQFSGQADCFRPECKHPLNAAVRLGVFGQHLQPGSRTDHVVRQREDDSFGVAVVGDFVTGAVSENATDVAAVGGVGAQSVGVHPMAAIVIAGDRRVVTAAQHTDRVPAEGGPDRLAARQILEPVQHVFSVPVASFEAEVGDNPDPSGRSDQDLSARPRRDEFGESQTAGF